MMCLTETCYLSSGWQQFTSSSRTKHSGVGPRSRSPSVSTENRVRLWVLLTPSHNKTNAHLHLRLIRQPGFTQPIKPPRSKYTSWCMMSGCLRAFWTQCKDMTCPAEVSRRPPCTWRWTEAEHSRRRQHAVALLTGLFPRVRQWKRRKRHRHEFKSGEHCDTMLLMTGEKRRKNTNQVKVWNKIPPKLNNYTSPLN